jgi:hypothetical protein
MIEWFRWAKASIYNHFNQLSFNKKFDGIETDKTEFQDWCEIRIEGPRLMETTRENFIYDYGVNIECLSTDMKDAYKLDAMIGEVVAYMLECIPLKKFGELTEETGEYLIRSSEVQMYPFSTPAGVEVKRCQIETNYRLRLNRSL